MSSGTFITGTDTGVGKTIVTASLLTHLRSAGSPAGVMKPVQTGCTRIDSGLQAPDPVFCINASGWRPTEEEQALIAPYRFEKACSPHLAARLAGEDISIPRIMQCFEELGSRFDPLLVEGAGGIAVPLSTRTTMLDLMQAMALPVILVARSGLGTINHSMLSLHRLRQAGLAVAGIVFNDTAPPDDESIAVDNIQIIGEAGAVRVLGRLPYADTIADPARLREFGKMIYAELDDT